MKQQRMLLITYIPRRNTCKQHSSYLAFLNSNIRIGWTDHLFVAFVPLFYSDCKKRVVIPCIIFTIASTLICIVWTVTFLPSVATTILKLRSGVIPTLQNPVYFQDLRNRMDLVNLLIGSLFWGTLFSSFIVGALFGGIAFLSLWQVRSRNH